MRTCARTDDVEDFVLGISSATAAAEIDAHLRGCRICNAAAQTLRAEAGLFAVRARASDDVRETWAVRVVDLERPRHCRSESATPSPLRNIARMTYVLAAAVIVLAMGWTIDRAELGNLGIEPSASAGAAETSKDDAPLCRLEALQCSWDLLASAIDDRDPSLRTVAIGDVAANDLMCEDMPVDDRMACIPSVTCSSVRQ